jgi:mannose-6-phosphate isomerase-like protein (cupin superfamily)
MPSRSRILDALRRCVLMHREVVMNKSHALSLAEALRSIPGPEGEPWAEVFHHGSLAVEVFSPKGRDTQQPHSRDEVYVVASGSGTFVHGDHRDPVHAGHFLFAAAGVEHRFEDFSDDFVVWVLFYGPEGGEKA